MIPDVLSNTEVPPNYNGQWNSGCFDSTKPGAVPPYTPLTNNNAQKRCFGRLPWKDLGMAISTPSENDPTGVMPWYAFSRNLIDAATPINSELLSSNPYPWLKVYDMNGILLSDRVAFVIIVPGPALPYQSRPLPPNLANPGQYLDKISLPAGCSPTGTPCATTYSNYDLTETFVTGDEHRWMNDPANPGRQIEDPTYQFNDKMLYVTIDELMPLIERRVAREVKSCLDDYALATGNTAHKYPWAAPVTDPTAPLNRTGTFGTLFGRFADQPSTATNSSLPTADDLALQDMIIAVQTALTQYLNGTGTLANLRNKGDALKDFAKAPPYNQAITDPARAAGIYADSCLGMLCTGPLAAMITTALNAIPGTPDPTMPSGWAGVPSCITLINSSYWPDWRDLIFYQVADGFQPGSAGACVSCLSISGSGNTNNGSGSYRAAVIVAGKILGTQTRAAPYSALPNDYLSNTTSESSVDPLFVSNAHNGVSPDSAFITYKPSDSYYQSVNDLALCVDGKNNCK